jgi:hypothetical protein
MALADPQPTPAMMAPVQALAAFMSTLHPNEHPSAFARNGVCVVENFAPYLFCGRNAALAWEAGFRAHAADEGLTELTARFAEAHDFSQSGNRCFFSLPTTWTGLTHGRKFEEHGAWAFVVQRHGAAWRILGYGYGVTSYTETANLSAGSSNGFRQRASVPLGPRSAKTINKATAPRPRMTR